METSKEMIDELLSYVDEGSFVLEPSAGRGDLAFALVRKGCTVDCMELNQENYAYLRTVGISDFRIIQHGNFLYSYPISDKVLYDAVVAVPPYQNNQDCEHIAHMYMWTKPGGRVVSFTHPAWVTGFYTNQVQFRKWLSDKKYHMKLFEDDKSYMSCPKMLLIIEK